MTTDAARRPAPIVDEDAAPAANDVVPAYALLRKLPGASVDNDSPRRGRTVTIGAAILRRGLHLERLDQQEAAELERLRPKTRADCIEGPRPCPFVGCRYNLYLDVKACGSITFNQVERQPWEMSESCALDIADRGGVTMDEIKDMLCVSRQRIDQIEKEALVRLRRMGDKDARDALEHIGVLRDGRVGRFDP